MSNTSVKVAIALFMVLTPPAASFARGGGHGGGHAGSAAMGAFARPAGSAGAGEVPVHGIPHGPPDPGGETKHPGDARGLSGPDPVPARPPLPRPAPAAP